VGSSHGYKSFESAAILDVVDLSNTTGDARAEIAARTEAKWRSEIRLAKAAIEEMRESTEEMDARGQMYMGGETATADTVWEVMIDAALEPGPHSERAGA
jgi:hypothetical protein